MTENAAAETATTETELVSRLTIKDLGCDPKAVKKLPEGQTKLLIARMYGLVNRIGFQEDKINGKTTAFFIGNFEGVNMQDGTVLQSSKMFLPDAASNALENIVNQVQKEKGKGVAVNFAFEISAVKAPNTSN